MKRKIKTEWTDLLFVVHVDLDDFPSVASLVKPDRDDATNEHVRIVALIILLGGPKMCTGEYASQIVSLRIRTKRKNGSKEV